MYVCIYMENMYIKLKKVAIFALFWKIFDIFVINISQVYIDVQFVRGNSIYHTWSWQILPSDLSPYRNVHNKVVTVL